MKHYEAPADMPPFWFWFILVALALLGYLCTGCAPVPRDAEYPRHDCRVGAEFTYYSDKSWSATGRSECGKAF